MSQKRQTPSDEPHYLVRTLHAQGRSGRTIERHAHSWHQLIYASAGVMTVWTEQGSWVAPPRWAVWASAGTQHSIRFTGETALRTLYLPPDAPDVPQRCCVIAVSPLLEALIFRSVELGMLDRRVPTHEAMARLIREELRRQDTPPLDLPLPSSRSLRDVAEHLSERPADAIGNAALARQFGLGIRTLERRFLAETGMPLGRWRRQARLFHALRRLAAGTPVKRVAIESGYRNASAFVAAFKKAFQTTPARYFGLP